jgi:flagellar hook-length control protein FliK
MSAGGSSTVGLAGATTAGQAPGTSAGASQASPAELGSINYGAGLQQAIETAHAAVALASRMGLSQARIALQPEELGEIRIHLSQTAEGLVARLTAETPAAAQALAAGHNELRQSLSSIGISLAHLDIGHLDQPDARGGADHHPTGGQAPPGNRDTSRATTAEGPETHSRAEELAPGAPALSGGTLVDVLV